jgi:hypothetical protein
MSMFRARLVSAFLASLPLALVGCTADNATTAASAAPAAAETGLSEATLNAPLGQVVGMRRLTELQYRNSIADIFGPEVKVAGRFEPIVRPVHELVATGASNASISPAGLEALDATARNIAEQVFSPALRASFVPCAPADEKAADAECARKTLTPIGRYLFRRPLTAQEQAAYVKMATDTVGPTKSFYKGMELALAAMLVSPNFLYIIESAEPDPARPGELRLDSFSRASRLSYLLWNSTPNEALLQAAERGKLSDQAQLAAVAASMVKSSRVEGGVRAFFSDMLLFEKFDDLSKDSVVYPRFNAEVAAAMPEQMLRTIVDHLLTRNGDYRELFTTPRTYMTRSLGPLYGVQVRQATGWEPYEFGPNDDRAGLLGQAAFLALYAHPGRSSATLRGRAIRELLLCQPVPNPPGNVNFTAVQDVNSKVMPTARMRLTAHNTDPVCSACHKITDPIGLSLERFDGIGAFRSRENDTQIDSAGLFEGASFQGALGLGKAMAASQSTTECVAGRALAYATGREVGEETETISALEKAFAADGYRFRSLLLRVATMPEAYQVKVKPLENAPPKVALAR